MEYHFKSIPNPSKGSICLMIHSPDSFFGHGEYCVMIGGDGVGRAKTLGEAKKLLKKRIAEDLERRIKDAEATAQHYRKQLFTFSLEEK